MQLRKIHTPIPYVGCRYFFVMLVANMPSICCSSVRSCTESHKITHLGALSCQDSEEVWKAVVKTNVVGSVICAMQDCGDGIQPIEYFREMASLLKTIIWRWSPFRYQVWGNAKLMDRLLDNCHKNDTSITLRVLQLCSVLGILLMVIFFIQFILRYIFFCLTLFI